MLFLLKERIDSMQNKYIPTYTINIICDALIYDIMQKVLISKRVLYQQSSSAQCATITTTTTFQKTSNTTNHPKIISFDFRLGKKEQCMVNICPFRLIKVCARIGAVKFRAILFHGANRGQGLFHINQGVG